MTPGRGESVISCANDQAVWPWQAEPYRLWSLLDMMRFYAASFLTAWTNLEILEGMVPWNAMRPDGGDDWPELQEKLRRCLEALHKECERLPISTAIEMQIERAANDIMIGTDYDNAAAMSRLVEIRKNVINELAQHYFLQVPRARRSYYEGTEPLFGEIVAAKFGDAARDIAAAGRCLALEESTAAVFHLMRVLEHGLRFLASQVGLASDAMALENWKNVIDQIEKKIREMEALPKSSSKSETMQRYSEAAVQFRYFKDAWRNHVSHSRSTYDGRDAVLIWNHVNQFMQSLCV
jgi:hypothetical protein